MGVNRDDELDKEKRMRDVTGGKGKEGKEKGENGLSPSSQNPRCATAPISVFTRAVSPVTAV